MAQVKAAIPNTDTRLRPGMFGSLDLTLVVRENATVIPEAAITQILTNGQAMVIAVDEGGTAQLRKIRTGVRLVNAVEVVEGLKPGEKVIVEGLQKVVPGAPVRIAPENGTAAGVSGSAEGKTEKPAAAAGANKKAT